MGGDERSKPQPVLLTPAEVVHLLDLDARDLKQMRDRAEGPAFHRLDGRLVRYSAADVRLWMGRRNANGQSRED